MTAGNEALLRGKLLGEASVWIGLTQMKLAVTQGFANVMNVFVMNHAKHLELLLCLFFPRNTVCTYR